MILQSLAQLAEREGLIGNPDFQIGEVSWVIRLMPDGAFLTLQSLLQEPQGKKKGRPRGQRVPIPRRSGRTSGVQADFLVDNAQYVLGLNVDPKKKSKTDRLEQCRRSFQQMVAAATDDAGTSTVGAVLAFLSGEQVESAKREVMDKADAKELLSNHLIAFSVEDLDTRFVHDLPEVQKYWGRLRHEASNQADGVQCLVTGEIAPPIDKHPPIKRVPGGSSSGVSIVSYNSSAFESYGFNRNDNAPVSRAAAEAYVTALNRLLDPSTPDPKDSQIRLPEQRVQISDDTVAVFWTDDSSEVPAAIRPALDEQDDALDFFDVQLKHRDDEDWGDPAPDADDTSSATALRDELERPWKGRKAEAVTDDAPFRLLILSGGQGRATVRRFHTSHTRAIVENIRRWFDDIDLNGWYGSRALYHMLRALALRGDRRNLPPGLASDVFVSILMGGPLPTGILEAAVRRARSEPEYRVTSQRAGLIKAFLIRSRDRLAGQGIHFEEINTTMNENEKNQGYVLGRLFACVERMQELALENVNANVADKYFSAACATPQAVFPRLLKTEVHHFGKAKDGKYPGSAHWLHKQIGEIANVLVGETNGMQDGEKLGHFLKRSAGRAMAGFPAFLPLPEQGLFTLGYHQQRNEFFKKRENVPTEATAE